MSKIKSMRIDDISYDIGANYENIDGTPTFKTINGNSILGEGNLVIESGAGAYSKPSSGIPKSDLSSAVQTSLGNADKSYNFISTIFARPNEYSIENTQVQNYLDEVKYTSDYTISSISTYNIETSYRKDEPFPYTIDLSDISENVNINVTDMDENEIASGTSLASETSYTIYNLFPYKSYYCTVTNNNNLILKLFKIKPIAPMRMIYVPSVNNVRDLGGWNGNGGTIKYGRIFRGGELDGKKGTPIASEDITRMRNLGIKAEVDLRALSETALSSSALGSDIDYIRVSIGVYEQIDPSVNANYAMMKTAIDKIISTVEKQNGVYFHCVSGADRTGTVAAIIEGVLGVAQSDIDKDYELTTFSNEGAEAYRVRTNNRWVTMINYLLSIGGSLENGAINYLLLLGYTANEINNFRQNMIDGTPSTITAHSVSYNLTNATSSINITSICDGSTFTATVEPTAGFTLTEFTCTMAGVTQTVTGNTVTIPNVTGDIIITAVGSSQVVYEWVTMSPTITYGLKLNSTTGVEEETGTTTYSASDKVYLDNASSVRLSNSLTGNWAANSQMYYYDDTDKLLGKGTQIILNSTSATTTTDAPPVGSTYARIRIYHSTQVGNAQSYNAAFTLEYYKPV